jgi:hypothetical protein
MIDGFEIETSLYRKMAELICTNTSSQANWVTRVRVGYKYRFEQQKENSARDHALILMEVLDAECGAPVKPVKYASPLGNTEGRGHPHTED